MLFYEKMKAVQLPGSSFHICVDKVGKYVVGLDRNSAMGALALALVMATGLGGCTSAPIDMAAATVDQAMVEEQARMREAASQLSALVDDNRWYLDAGAEEATQSFFGRLVAGRSENEEDEARPSPVSAYIAANPNLADALGRDTQALIGQTSDLSRLVISVASSDVDLPSDALSRDIASSEAALTSVRRAKAFFREVLEQVGFSDADRISLEAQVNELARKELDLAVATDALAERRWGLRNGLFG